MNIKTRPPFGRRLSNLLDRLRWMSRLTGSVTASLALILQIRRDVTAVRSLTTPSGPIHFRGIDEQALKEVLVDREYAFLTDFVLERESLRVADVGAHIGTFALWLLQANPGARILSVEADPCTCDVLKQNAAPRRDEGLDWTPLHAAAGARDGDLVLLSNEGPSMSHRVDSQGTIAVPTVSLAALLNHVAGADGTVDLMKVDIEGSEEAFLADADGLLDRVNAIVIELHPSLCDTGRVHALLNEHFDLITTIGNRHSSKPLLYCRRSSSAGA